MTMTQKKLHVKSGDRVEVTTGVYKGAQGRVLEVMPDEGKVMVEGVNIKYKHVRRTRDNPRGGRTEMEAPIDASNVMVVCNNRECERYDRGVRIRKQVQDDGSKIRTCVKCGEEIATPE